MVFGILGAAALVQNLGQTWEEEVLARGITRGELRACRVMLRGILGDRFGQLPEELIRRIETTEDIELLQSCIRQAGRITALDQVTL